MLALSPPRLRDLFDLKLILACGLLAFVAFQACDVVNRKIDQRFSAGGAPPDPKKWEVGQTMRVGITLVTKDADRLACASDLTFGTAHCEFKQNKQRWPKEEGAIVDDNGVDLIVPYRTTIGGTLIFVTALWDNPALAFRRHREPSRSIPETKLKRFTANCSVEFLGKFETIELRWDYSKPWYTEKNAMVARAKDCVIE